ncbi:MAG: hypothetical protein B7Y02_16700, partial [Rhodobacterales bacterium 17-64-5]
MINTVLLVDDDRAVREALGQTLELADLRPILCGSYIEAKDHIAPAFPGVVVTDIRMPGKDGFALLTHARALDADLPVILLTGEGDIPMAVRGIAAGAFDFLEKPCAPADLLAVIDKALKTRALVLENRILKRQLQSGDAAARMIFGRSRLSEDLRDRVRVIARASAGVLITGEPGTGIPKIAEVIHLMSGAAARPFQKLAGPTATPAALSQLFVQAEGGTIFEYLQNRDALLEEEEVLYLFVQMVLSLQQVHEHNILHRDLKTQNIMLDRTRKVCEEVGGGGGG